MMRPRIATLSVGSVPFRADNHPARILLVSGLNNSSGLFLPLVRQLESADVECSHFVLPKFPYLDPSVSRKAKWIEAILAVLGHQHFHLIITFSTGSVLVERALLERPDKEKITKRFHLAPAFCVSRAKQFLLTQLMKAKIPALPSLSPAGIKADPMTMMGEYQALLELIAEVEGSPPPDAALVECWIDPADRVLSLNRIMQHPWFRGAHPLRIDQKSGSGAYLGHVLCHPGFVSPKFFASLLARIRELAQNQKL